MSNAAGVDASRTGCSTITFRLVPLSDALVRIAACGLTCAGGGVLDEGTAARAW